MSDLCTGRLHPRAIEGFRLFNQREFFEAHEALEDAWRDEKNDFRELYRGILQAAVVYMHITRNNYTGAIKVYRRSQKWLADWPEICRGIHVGQLRRDLDAVIASVHELGPDGLVRFDRSLLKPVKYEIQS